MIRLNWKAGVAIETRPYFLLLGVGTSSRCSDTYHGPRPFSEVETYNVAKYLLKQRRNLIGYMDIHAYSQLWMTPWGYKSAYPDDGGEQVGAFMVIRGGGGI